MAVRTAENDLSSIYQDLLLGNVAFPGHTVILFAAMMMANTLWCEYGLVF